MNKLFKSQSLSVGLAMFSMFFGAGNVVFPLAVGIYSGDKNMYAMIGLVLTAVIMPIAGVVAMVLFDGNYRQFFGRLGKIPGSLLVLIIISLIGPLGGTPRCIALSYSTLKMSFPDLSFIVFSAVACGIIFLFTVRKNHILSVLGWVLTPILLCSLITIIVMGLTSLPDMQNINHTSMETFLHGLKEGYNTMDLLAAFFFSSTILNVLRMKNKESKETSSYANIAFGASIIGALLLAAIYVSFSYLAVFHGSQLHVHGTDELLAAITMKIAGANAGVLVCITIAVACLTTAIALISVFTDFMQKEVLKGKVRYEVVLIISLLLTFLVSTFRFTGVSTFLGPILQVCYPGLIALTALNIMYSLKDFKPIKAPVFSVFFISLCIYFLQRVF
ncbi:MAG: branched-chain amino acid transport system II carrier protein [Chlamydiota bacterium]|jgi:LIVCS family branched-chain amino acid:cation transporter